jgi:hypothetical protein
MTVEVEPRGITGLAASISTGLIGALPPAFLFLCVINLAFLGLVLWFVEHQLDQRMGLANKIVEHCWQSKP